MLSMLNADRCDALPASPPTTYSDLPRLTDLPHSPAERPGAINIHPAPFHYQGMDPSRRPGEPSLARGHIEGLAQSSKLTFTDFQGY